MSPSRRALGLLLLSACRAPDTGDVVDTRGVGDSAVSDTQRDTAHETGGGTEGEPRLDLAPGGLATTEHFATAAACQDCHSNEDAASAMRDAAGRPVAPWDLARGSMMANAARDPFWWAAVRYEADPWPLVEEDIEAGCTVCHAPGLAAESRLTHVALPTLETLRGVDADAVVGLDGVTCTVCHQVEATGLGQEETFNGEFVTVGAALAYGPYGDPVLGPMEAASGYLPAPGAQVDDPGLCASCHMVQNSILGDRGEPTSKHLDEQTVYAEWLASAYATPGGATPTTCQACHLPQLDQDGLPIAAAIARDPEGGDVADLPVRSPYGRHTLLGGNAYVLTLLRDNVDELAPGVPAAVFDAQASATRAFLRGAADLVIGTAVRDGDTLQVPVTVVNRTGHKLPTGFPSRRMWLEIRVTDRSGAVVFQSGAFDAVGQLLAPDGAPLVQETVGGSYHPHRDTLTSGQVQVWESVLSDNRRDPLYLFLVALRVAKDDRILPVGWATADAVLAPVGTEDDLDHLPGSDTVTLLVPAPEGEGPFEVTAALRYQAIGARYMAEILEGTDDTVRVLERMVEASDRTPETLAEVSARLE